MGILKDMSKFKILLLGIPRNAIIFLLGLFFYAMAYGKINILNATLGLISMLIAYSAVYPFNDISDVEYDKKDSFRKKKNPITDGKLKIDNAISLVFLLLILGFLFSIPLNAIFKIMFFFALFLNFLNSSNYSRFHKRSPFFKSVFVFLMQFSKFSMGWFSQTLALVNFPLAIGFVVGAVYSGFYYAYKRQILSPKEFFKNKKVVCAYIFLSIVVAGLTLVFFEFKFLLLNFLMLLIGYVILLKMYGVKKTLFKSVFHVLYSLILATTLLSIYFYSASSIPHRLDILANNGTEEIRVTIENATNSTLYKIVDEIEKFANVEDIMSGINKTVIVISINGTNE